MFLLFMDQLLSNMMKVKLLYSQNIPMFSFYQSAFNHMFFPLVSYKCYHRLRKCVYFHPKSSKPDYHR